MEIHRIEKYLIIGIIALTIIVSSGYSFAYFTVQVNNPDKINAEVTADPATLPQVVFDAGKAVTSTNPLIPGEKITKTFNVTFTPTKEFKTTKYNIVFNITNNTFKKCTDNKQIINDTVNNCTIGAKELVYTLKRSIGSQTAEATNLATNEDITDFSSGTKSYIETITSDTPITYYYTLEITFLNTGANQLHNMSKTINGTVDVLFTE